MKKILFFIPSLAGGGAEKVLVNMVNHLDKEKYDITVKCLFDVGVNKKYLAPHIKYQFLFRRTIRGNIYLLKLFSAEFLYRRMINEHYDIVVSYFQSPTTRIVAGAIDSKTKLVQWIHNEFHQRKEITKCYRSEKEAISLQKRFDATVYVANSVKDTYLRTFPELSQSNHHVLYNIVESDKIKELANQSVAIKSIDPTLKTLVAVGRMVPQKSFDRLLNCVHRLTKDGFKTQLLLLGTGQLENQLKKQAKQLNIEDRVLFLGYQDNPYKFVKHADLFVCSSLHEGFSTAVTESLIVGTPVITTDCSGMSELLGDNEFGVIVENEEAALYQRLKELLFDESKLNHYTEQAKIRGGQFNTEQRVREIERFFDGL